MAQQCALCDKKKNPVWRTMKLRGKYNPTVKQSQKPNLQWVTLPVQKAGFPLGTRLKACTKCIKAFAKNS